MSETSQEAQEGVADAVRGLSDNTRTLVRREIAAAELEMLGKAKQAMPSVALLGAAGLFGVLSLAASYRLSVRLLEKSMPPATAALVAATGYGAAAGASGAVGIQRLRADKPLVPVETVRAAVSAAAGKVKAVAGSAAKTATDTAKKAASGVTATPAADKAKAVAGTAANKTKATAGTATKKATDTAKKAAPSTTAETAPSRAKATSGSTAKTAASRAKATTGATAKKATGTKKPADTTQRTTRPRTSRQAATSE
jgi:hypothetical protein